MNRCQSFGLVKSIGLLLAQKYAKKEFFQTVLTLVKSQTGWTGIGFRELGIDGGIRFELSMGFSRRFLAAESRLSRRRRDNRTGPAPTGFKPDYEDYIEDIFKRGPLVGYSTGNCSAGPAGGQSNEYLELGRTAGYSSLAVVPVEDRQGPVGLLYIADNRPAGLSAANWEVIELLVAGLGAAVAYYNQVKIEDQPPAAAGRPASRLAAFEQVISQIAARFAGNGDFDQAALESLADIGTLYGAAGAHLFTYQPAARTLTGTHEWRADGGKRPIDLLPALAVSDYLWGARQMRRQKYIRVIDRNQLPPAARNEKALMERLGARSLLVFPLSFRAELFGVIALVYEQEQLANRETDFNLLKIAAGIIAKALERRRVGVILRQTEEHYRTIFENTGAATVVIDEHAVISLVNSEFERFSGLPKEEVESKKKWGEFIAAESLAGLRPWFPTSKDDISSEYGRARNFAAKLVDSNGRIRDVIMNVARLPGTNSRLVSFFDVTARKRDEEKLNYLTTHDRLTGLYNRTYYEGQLRRLDENNIYPVSVISCDVDGLKKINDNFGPNAGDKILRFVAGILRNLFTPSGVLARIGGDEFALLVPGVEQREIEQAAGLVKEAVTKYNQANSQFSVSVSVGWATRSQPRESMVTVFREAENAMYREKLHQTRSTHSAVVQTLMKALEARDFITEGHGFRLQDMAAELAKQAGLPDLTIIDLRLLAQFHDVGKLGIPDKILFKPGSLTVDEYRVMQQHCEIGYRIASASADLSPISEWILRHHEWWNGQGYPLGIKGEEIPRECRILAIVDAYDAMTSDRPYRKALSIDQALAELKKWAGIQFDPELVEKFIEQIKR